MKKNPLSQTSLSRSSGVHPMTVSKFLRGQPIRSDAAARLEKALEGLGVVDVARLEESTAK